MDATALRLKQAIVLHNTGRRGEAARIYSELIDAGNFDPELYHLLGAALLQEGRPQEAITPLRQAVAADPSSSLYQSNLGAACRDLGEFVEAERLFRKAIELSPEFAGAHFNLAMLLATLGRGAEAVAGYRRAIIADPHFAQAYGNLGTLLGRLNRREEALAALEKAVELSPRSAELRFNLGNGYVDSLRWQDGIRELKTAAELAPSVPQVWNNLGSALLQRERFKQQSGEIDGADRGENEAEGEAALRRALQLDPTCDDARGNLADALQRRGKLAEAIEELRFILARQPERHIVRQLCAQVLLAAERHDEAIVELRQLVKVEPDCAAHRAQLARAHQSCGRLDDAIEAARDAVRLDGKNGQSWMFLGNLLMGRREYRQARHCYGQALALAPQDSIAWYNLGNVGKDEGELAEAEQCYRRAIEWNATFRQAHINLGVVLDRQGRPEEALAAHERAVQLGPDDAEARFHRALSLLAAGNFFEGWREYEWRRPYEGMAAIPAERQWSGERLNGRGILIRAEQGIGDEVMFASCIPEVAVDAARCVVECDPRLVPLLQRSIPQAEFRARVATSRKSRGQSVIGNAGNSEEAGDAKPWETSQADFDHVIDIGSLPGVLRQSERDFPMSTRFLYADRPASHRWKSHLQQLGEGLKVGVSWRGGKDAAARRHRSLPLSQWAPILETPGVTFVNLQYGDSTTDLAELARCSPNSAVHCLPGIDPLSDLDGFAALLASLDLVISIDNSTVHLSGGLGVPTWVMLPMAANWRWLRHREDSVWYRQMRLFRQSVPGAWDQVIRQIADELRELAEPGLVPEATLAARRLDAGTKSAAASFSPHASLIATRPAVAHTGNNINTSAGGGVSTRHGSFAETRPVAEAADVLYIARAPGDDETMRAGGCSPEVRDQLATREQEKYEFIWKHDAYRQTSFGLIDAEKVGLIDQLRKYGVRTLLDAGCGSGKLLRKLITEHGGEFDVRGFDISNNCLDPYFDDMKDQILTVGCLWNPDDFQTIFDGVVCTDVLEHIPTDKVPAVLGNLSRCTRKFCYLAIALFPDRFGPELIGAPLHLTVKEPEWWCEAISRAGFHIVWHGVERHRSGQNMWLHAFLVPQEPRMK